MNTLIKEYVELLLKEIEYPKEEVLEVIAEKLIDELKTINDLIIPTLYKEEYSNHPGMKAINIFSSQYKKRNEIDSSYKNNKLLFQFMISLQGKKLNCYSTTISEKFKSVSKERKFNLKKDNVSTDEIISKLISDLLTILEQVILL